MNRLRHRLKTIAIAIFAAATFGLAAADQVILILKNGDKLSGELLSENADRIVLKTSWNQKVTIPQAQIQKKEKPAPPAAAAATNAPTAKPATTPAPPAAAAKPAAPPVKPAAPLTATTNKVHGTWTWLRYLTNWKGSFEVGANLGFGTRDYSIYYAKLNATTMSMSNRLRNSIDYSFDYGKTAGLISANKMNGGLKTDYDVFPDKKVFIYNKGSAGYDEIQRIDLQYEEGAGVGYHLLSLTNTITPADALNMNVETGALYQKFDYFNRTEKQNFSVRVAENIDWSFTNTKVKVTEKWEVTSAVGDFADYISRFEANVSYPVFKRLSLSFTLLDVYTSRPISTVQKNDLQLRSSLKVTF